MDWFKYFSAFLAVSAFILCTAYYLRFWPLELLVSFAPLATCLLLAALTLSGFFIFLRNPVIGSLTITALVLAGIFSICSLWKSLTVQPVSKFDHGKSDITFVTLNREFSNHNYKLIAGYLRSQKPDVVALQEASREAVKAIGEETGAKYSYISAKLNTVKGTGAALISKYPLKNTGTIDIGEHSSLVRGEVRLKNKTMAFYSLHLVGPFSPNRYGNRGHDIRQAAAQLASEKLPAVLGGDFNTTPYSPDLRRFNEIVSSRYQTTTVQPWAECTRYNINPLLCLRIDHIYISKSLKLTDTYKSGGLGSDHRALAVKLRIN